MTVQRMSDIVIALVLLLLCLPVLLLASAVLALEQSRNPIQSSARAVHGGRVISLYRLRVTEPTPFGPRVTVGGAMVQRLHLDHIPMLINVLLGDLTLVGSRQKSTVSPRVLAEWPFSGT